MTPRTPTQLCQDLQPVEGKRHHFISLGGNLRLWVDGQRNKVWRFHYRAPSTGKHTYVELGQFPAMSVAAARVERSKAVVSLAEGRDPRMVRQDGRRERMQLDRATLISLCRAWHQENAASWADRTRKTLDRLIGKVAADPLAGAAIDTVRPVELKSMVEAMPAYMRDDVATIVSGACAIAISEGLIRDNPMAAIRSRIGKGLAEAVAATVSFPEATLPQARTIMAAVEAADVRAMVKAIVRFQALTALRSSEVEALTWAMVDLDAGVITLPASVMKGKREHVVALARQAVETLREVQQLATARQERVFPTDPVKKGQHALLRSLDIVEGFVPHSWRGTFSTVMNEACNDQNARATIDRMLAHAGKGVSAVEAVYNRAKHIEARRELAQQWADMLLGAQVVRLHKAA